MPRIRATFLRAQARYKQLFVPLQDYDAALAARLRQAIRWFHKEEDITLDQYMERREFLFIWDALPIQMRITALEMLTGQKTKEDQQWNC